MSPKSYGAKKATGAKTGKKTTKSKKTSEAKKRAGGRSPVSRYALLFVALILPLRRRLRNANRAL